jgi:hypothetical protein
LSIHTISFSCNLKESQAKEMITQRYILNFQILYKGKEPEEVCLCSKYAILRIIGQAERRLFKSSKFKNYPILLMKAHLS